MSVDIEKLTERDIKEFKRDIESYQKKQKLFLTLGFVFMGLFIFFLLAGIACTVLFVLNHDDRTLFFLFMGLMDTAYSLAGTFIVVMIAMFILRGALFNGKIENRRRAIEDWEEFVKPREITHAE